MPAITNDQQAAIVESAIRGISHIATLPEVTLKIIALVEDPNSTAQDLHKVIANDPALCSRILKVVNSAFYGLPRQIGSINRAIVLLGLNAVKNIAIAASLSKLFRGGELCPQFSARDLWMHSIACATASKLMCDQLRLGLPDEAFLAGLIHDIGIMVEMQADRHKLVEVFNQLKIGKDRVPQADMRQLEQQFFGADHEAFGAGLCEAWKFPKSFANVAGHHHNPAELPTASRPLATIVHIADRLVAQAPAASCRTTMAGTEAPAASCRTTMAGTEARGGFRGDLMTTEIDAGLVAELGLGFEHIEAIKGRLPQAIKEIEATFAG